MNFVCYAEYEVVKAKTVANSNIYTEEEQVLIPTFNDPELPDFQEDNCVGGYFEKKVKNFIRKRKSKKAKEEELESDDIIEEEIVQAKPRMGDNDVVDNKNKFEIDADKIMYDEEDGNIYAKGNVKIIAKNKNTTLKADEAVLDKNGETIKLYKNVKVIKNGTEMLGEYLVVDLNEQNILMDAPSMNVFSFNIKAQEGYVIANDIQMLNGTIKTTQQTNYNFESKSFRMYDDVSMNGKSSLKDYSNMQRSGKQVYKVDAKEVVFISYKDHNSMLIKKANVYYNNHRIMRNSDIEIITDKDKIVTETSSFEFGVLRGFGSYFGYGFANRLPNGQTLRIMPAFTYGDNNIGVGALVRHKSLNNILDVGWSTSTTNAVVRGRYRLSDSLSLSYGRSAYFQEGFMGSRRPGYIAQLEYRKNYVVEDLKDTYFSHGVYGGIFSDYRKQKQEDAYATTRFRYMAELRKQFFEWKNKEQDLSMSVSGIAQGAATLYGSGQTTGVVRVGPYLTTKLKFWESNIGYMFGGVHGDSPFIFDKYRYGRSTIIFHEKININDKFALGFRANVSPLKDNYEDKLLTESRFYVMFGPQDLKLVLSYDFVRDTARLEFLFLLGTESSRINFEKMTAKGFDGGNQREDFYKIPRRVKIVEPENI